MNKIVNLLGTGEKQWCCELLQYNFSSRNKTNNKDTKISRCENNNSYSNNNHNKTFNSILN